MDTNPKQPQLEDDILVRVDKETAEQIKKISEEMKTSIKDTTRWLTWLAGKCMGRKVIIQDDKDILEISLKEYHKFTELDIANARKAK